MSIPEKVKETVSRMTNEQKALLLSGKDFWHLHAVADLGLDSIMVTDGPHGLRKQKQGSVSKSEPSTCFPAGCATACSFDPALMYDIGEALAEECLEQEVAVILGPGLNHKRSPLCGRNFEYFSEDPLLTGKIAAGLINGIQSKKIGTSVKHFACNNQEKARMCNDSVVDERTLREIYLKNYEIAVKESQPYTIMTAYNKLNGMYCAENKRLLNGIAREEWGFEGLFMTDWGGINDPVAALSAGLDLEMPSGGKDRQKSVLKALSEGQISQKDLDAAATRLVTLIVRYNEAYTQAYSCDMNEHLRLAQRAAQESAVLLKNDENILPLKEGQSIAVIGKMAKNMRYQGAGSSRITPYALDNPYDALLEKGIRFEYSNGYDIDAKVPEQAKIWEAEDAAKNKDIVLIFAGLPDSYESEGFDRKHMDLPPDQNKLIEAIAKINKNVIVVLQCGSAVTMPWINDVKGVLLMSLAGCQGGKAAAELLTGEANPCGRLSETYPLWLEDTPCYPYYLKDHFISEYREGIFTGYRYYDTADKTVLFPFGYGLSYTTFEYSDLKTDKTAYDSQEAVKVTLEVQNTGTYRGKEVVQLYVSQKNPTIFRPKKELKAFAKIELEAGERKTVEFILDQDAFSFYNVAINDWYVESDAFEIMIGRSVSDIVLSNTIEITNDARADIPDYRETAPAYYNLSKDGDYIPAEQFEAVLGRKVDRTHHPRPFTPATTVSELGAAYPGKFVELFVKGVLKTTVGKVLKEDGMGLKNIVDAMILDGTLKTLRMTRIVSYRQVDVLASLLEGKPVKAIKKLF